MAKKLLLVPGFQNKKFDARSKFEKLADRLEKSGYDILISDYGHGEAMKSPILEFASELSGEIKTFKPDAIIAHSMGCLVARHAVEKMGCGYPGLKLILIEGPHQGMSDNGSSLERFAVKIFEIIKRLPDRDVPNWQSWKDMQKDSEFLNQLNLSGRNNHVAKSTMYYYEIGGLFAYLFPEIFSLPHTICCTEKRIFRGVGHSGLKTNPEVIDYIIAKIEKNH